MNDRRSAPIFDADNFLDAEYLRDRAARFRALAAEHRLTGNRRIAEKLNRVAADLEKKAIGVAGDQTV